jgi:hypothetical protein
MTTQTTPQWAVYEQDTGDRHVMPLEDLKPHIYQECWCCPKRDATDDYIVIHNAMDEREQYEQGRKLS